MARPCRRDQLLVWTRRNVSSTSVRWSTAAPEPPTPEEAAELEAASPESIAEEAIEKAMEAPEETETQDKPESRGWQPKSYNEFLSSIGAKYKFAKPINWLGDGVVRVVLCALPRAISDWLLQPFPMNPSFKPPPPLSDIVRQKIYNEFMADPKKNNVRALSQRYHLSLKRIDAILRLKGLEHAWYKVSLPVTESSLT